jgi:hypothetical protein
MFLASMNSKLKWYLLSDCNLFTLRLFLKNHFANFNQTWNTATLGVWNSLFFKQEALIEAGKIAK